MILRRGRGGLFMEMGTGKTFVSMFLARHNKIKRVLVVCPLYAASVWKDELEQLWPDASFVDASKRSIIRRADCIASIPKDEETTFVTVGYQSYWREPLRKAILDWKPELVILDEGHKIAHRKSKQSRFAHILGDKVQERGGMKLVLSGTPLPGGIEGLWSLFRFLNPEVFGTRWVEFEVRYLKMGGFQGKVIKGYRHKDEIERILEKHAYRITKEEAGLQIPPETDQPIRLDLHDRKTYDTLKKEALVEVEGLDAEGNVARGKAFSRIVLTNIMRLQQITSGFVKTGSGIASDPEKEIVIGSEKLDALADLLEDVLPSSRKVVVFCRFTQDIRRVTELARTRAETYVLAGGIDQTTRDEHLKIFQTENRPMILVGQIAVSSLAINLSAANVGIFYSIDPSLINWQQARSRIHREGQKRSVTYYHLIMRNTVDEDIYDSLLDKREVVHDLLDKKRLRAFFEGSNA